MNHKILASLVYLNIICPMALLAWTELENAEADGAKMKMTFVVVDNDNKAVSNAWIQGGMYCDTGASMGSEFAGYTDGSGRFTISGKTTGRVVYSIMKENFYQTSSEYDFARKEPGYTPTVNKGKWQPYGLEYTVMIKRIYAATAKPFSFGYITVPAFGQWMGFDLEMFDLCPPYGKGIHKDILLRYVFDRDPIVRGKTYASMEMSFTNNPHAGAYILKKDGWSDFQSCYVADTNNTFSIKSFKYESSRTREEIFKNEDFPEDSYIVFRTRTTVDRDGNLISAHYGKIYGGWDYPRQLHFGGTLFNSNPNDPNLEDEESGIRARLNIKGMRERGELK